MSRLTLRELAPKFIEWGIPGFDEIKPDLPSGTTEAHLWQAGRCGICGTHERQSSKRHALDHDHETGLVRGLLCTGCNLQEGWQPNYTFAMWRGGLNPCAIFGWHYLYRAGLAPQSLTLDEAERFRRHAAIREEALQVQIAADMKSFHDAIAGPLP